MGSPLIPTPSGCESTSTVVCVRDSVGSSVFLSAISISIHRLTTVGIGNDRRLGSFEFTINRDAMSY